jgi:hypothetical protein
MSFPLSNDEVISERSLKIAIESFPTAGRPMPKRTGEFIHVCNPDTRADVDSKQTVPVTDHEGRNEGRNLALPMRIQHSIHSVGLQGQMDHAQVTDEPVHGRNSLRIVKIVETIRQMIDSRTRGRYR